MSIHKSDAVTLNSRGILSTYDQMPFESQLFSSLNIVVGSSNDISYIRNFGGVGILGKSTYRFVNNTSSIEIPIKSGNYSKINITFMAGMYGVSDNPNTLDISTNLCNNLYKYTFNKNDYTESLNFSVPISCINNNVLTLLFYDNPGGNQILFTNILFSKSG